MSKPVKRILATLALLVVAYAFASVVATVSQLADAADRAYDGAGQYTFWVLLATFSGLFLAPVAMYFRLPKPLKPPATTEEPAYSRYRDLVLAELRCNPHLAGVTLDSATHIPAAMCVLSDKADRSALRAASAIFVSTAMMQNGRLDGLIVLAGQLRLIWQIASIYHIRPTPRQALYVYSNVSAAVLVASNLDAVDFSEMASPIVTAAAPGLVSAVPGLGGVSKVLVNSLASGAANAFLTLRVAMLAKAYCEALVQPDAGQVRRSASVAAMRLVSGVTRDCGVQVVKWVLKGAAQMLAGTVGRASPQRSATAEGDGAAPTTVGAPNSAEPSTTQQRLSQKIRHALGRRKTQEPEDLGPGGGLSGPEPAPGS